MSGTPTPFTGDDCRRNLRAYLFFRVIYNFGLWYPIWVLYLNDELGLSFTVITALDFLYQFAIVFLDVPTGMLADLVGRRWSLFGSAAAIWISLGLFALASNVWWVLASFIVWSLTTTMLNGADAALLYDTLASVGREAEFPKTLGRFTSIAMIASVVASIIGGWLAEWGYRVPIVAHMVLLPLGAFAVLRVREPPRAEGFAPARPRQIVEDMRVLLRKGARFRILLAYSASLNAVMLMVVIYAQPLLLGSGLSVERIGWFYAAAMLLASAGPLVTTWATLRFGLAPTLWSLAGAVSLATLAIFYAPGLWVMLPLIGAEFLISGVAPVVIEGMNRMVGPEGRATVLSLRGVVNAGVAGPLEMLSGWWADRLPLRRVFLACGLALPLLTGTLMWLWRRAPTQERISSLSPLKRGG